MFRLLLANLILLCAVAGIAQSHEGQKVKITTMFGDIVVILYDDTPIHRDNFIKNVKNGWLDKSLFHRVIEGFMIQGGDPNSIDAPETQVLGSDRCVTLQPEVKRLRFHKKGALAAARLPDSANPQKYSSGCQFYIVQGRKYTDTELDNMETEYYKFPDANRAYYKVRGGVPFLDMDYTVFGEVIEGMEIVDLIAAMPTGKHVKDRPNTDIKANFSLIP